ncbi:hypothetical protein [Phytohabitans houttuyneae]|uniref:Cytochrome b561 bacterial/Ni-hydrogenase domain-containing protein n=1 Tax=Phytohabitans houttuyneae TaxID=1076126 RepID=A0A6V8JW56_9ACTN|nr:hypothetical protein [Phytohabitans houttuyneae]GFJ76862.1 hypothetical protein Phou_010420 [Phytohabitans houttuyneae]
MTANPQSAGRVDSGFLTQLNTKYHRPALMVFLLIVLAHWAEHVVQAVQIWGLGWKPPEARGVLGLWFPWLVREEWLHYTYALVMLAGLIALRPGFTGSARAWWSASMWIQVWHHGEHLLLLIQAMSGTYLAGRAAPTSIVQLVAPRVELHLFYNAIVFLPMVIAMYLHLRPSPADREQMRCNCAGPRLAVGTA